MEKFEDKQYVTLSGSHKNYSFLNGQLSVANGREVLHFLKKVVWQVANQPEAMLGNEDWCK